MKKYILLLLLLAPMPVQANIFDEVGKLWNAMEKRPGVLYDLSDSETYLTLQGSIPVITVPMGEVQVSPTLDLITLQGGEDFDLFQDWTVGASLLARSEHGIASLGISWTEQTSWAATATFIFIKF